MRAVPQNKLTASYRVLEHAQIVLLQVSRSSIQALHQSQHARRNVQIGSPQFDCWNPRYVDESFRRFGQDGEYPGEHCS